jgi:hypothetical protein
LNKKNDALTVSYLQKIDALKASVAQSEQSKAVGLI